MSTISSSKTIHEIELFAFIRVFFTDDKTYSQLTNKAKMKHMFMFYRYMSIMYPIQMHKVNGIHDVRLMDQLHHSFCTPSSKLPKWVYTKSQQVKSEKDSLEFPREVIDNFCQVYSLENKSLEFLLSIDKEFVLSEMKKISEEMKNDSKKSKIPKKK